MTNKECQKHIDEWNTLADEVDELMRAGLIHPTVAKNKASLYRRMATAIDIERNNGKVVCPCCLKQQVCPFQLNEKGELK